MINYLFPEGRRLVLTFSYDDGNRTDIRVADILTEAGLKGTFNFCGKMLQREGKVTADEVKPLFIDRGHEVACHGFEHPFEEKLPLQCVVEDIRTDRLVLEKAAGTLARGMAYPYGTFSPDVKNILRALGIAYCRTVRNSRTTYMPDDFLEWDPTTHHNGDIQERGETFLKTPGWYGTHMLYIWGHAYEYENAKNWFILENFCKLMKGHGDTVWYATNIEICDYIQAFRNLRFSMDLHTVFNPGAITVWVQDNEGNAVAVPAGGYAELA